MAIVKAPGVNCTALQQKKIIQNVFKVLKGYPRLSVQVEQLHVYALHGEIE